MQRILYIISLLSQIKSSVDNPSVFFLELAIFYERLITRQA